MVAKDFLDYVLRDDATPYGGVSFHGETLADFIAETDLDENSGMDTVNQALIECGIMPIPFDGMSHAFCVAGRGIAATPNMELVEAVRLAVVHNDGYFSVPDSDADRLQICDGVGDNGEDAGEWHCVTAMDCNGVFMDDGDFYPYYDLTDSDLHLLLDYLNGK